MKSQKKAKAEVRPIRDIADHAAARTMRNRKAAITRDPKRRCILRIAARVKQHRAIGGGFIESLGEWFVLKSTPDDLREIARALELANQNLNPWRLNLIRAYQSALQENDPRFHWPGFPKRNAPGPLEIERSAIKSPPTIEQLRAHFIRLFGERCWAKPHHQADGDRTARKTITEVFKLPLADMKPGPKS